MRPLFRRFNSKHSFKNSNHVSIKEGLRLSECMRNF
jgi:hypothetical protein